MKLGTIWIGDDSKRPDRLLQTWQDKHSELDYVIYDNKFLKSRTWKNQHLISQYWWHEDYAGVADIMRYEILLDEEVFIHPADSECLHSIMPLIKNRDILTVYENEKAAPGLISPVYYAKPNHPFVKHLVDNLPYDIFKESEYMKPWTWTGNLYMQKCYELKDWGFKPVPSYRFTPVHHSGLEYKGRGKIYARQFWGSTFDIYGDL